MKYKNLLSAAVILLAVLITAGGFLHFSDRNPSKISPKSLTSKDLEAERPKTPGLEAELLGEVKLLFVGDIMLDRYIRQVAEKKGYDFIFGDTDNILKNNDLVIGNLEGPITNNK